MRVGVIQSGYIPWRGYFDFIDSVDLFIFYDDIQYSKNNWRNRNRIKTAQGCSWLTVPVKYKKTSQRIDETCIDHAQPWRRNHRNKLTSAYKKTHYFGLLVEEFFPLLDGDYATISELNVALCGWCMEKLGIQTHIAMSSEYAPNGAKTERLIGLLKAVGATTYLSGPSASAYLDVSAFHAEGIGLEYKSYDYAPYPQLWSGFEPFVSALDLIGNLGPQARSVLKSRTPDILVVAPSVHLEGQEMAVTCAALPTGPKGETSARYAHV